MPSIARNMSRSVQCNSSSHSGLPVKACAVYSSCQTFLGRWVDTGSGTTSASGSPPRLKRCKSSRMWSTLRCSSGGPTFMRRGRSCAVNSNPSCWIDDYSSADDTLSGVLWAIIIHCDGSLSNRSGYCSLGVFGILDRSKSWILEA